MLVSTFASVSTKKVTLLDNKMEKSRCLFRCMHGRVDILHGFLSDEGMWKG